MIFKERDKAILKRITSNLLYAQRAELDKMPVQEMVFLSQVIMDSVLFGDILTKREDYMHAKEYMQVAIECNVRIMRLLREMDYSLME